MVLRRRSRFGFAAPAARLGVLAVLCLLLGQITPALAGWHEQEAAIMGTSVRVALWHPDPAQARRAARTALDELRRIDASMSPYREDSDLSRINRSVVGLGAVVPAELRRLVRIALRVSQWSDGAFDITFAAAGQRYDYRRGVRPADAELDALSRRIDYRAVRVDEDGGRIGFERPGMRMDLGGIAKGYAVEQAVRRLRDLGVAHALVSAGGDTRVLGDRRGRPWMVALRDPRREDGLLTRTPLVDEAISTSGDYERYFEADGKRYHHIINPATADSARALRSVTVIGPDATLTDALSTSVFVLGAQPGLRLIDGLPGYEAILVDAEGRLLFSAGLKPLAAAEGAYSP